MNLSELSEEELIKLLSLEKEKRIIAERNVEAVNQALLQIKVLLDKRQDSEATLKRSVSSSSNSLNSPLPRAFSQEFYDLILHDLPDEVQSTLAIQGHSSAEGGLYIYVNFSNFYIFKRYTISKMCHGN